MRLEYRKCTNTDFQVLGLITTRLYHYGLANLANTSKASDAGELVNMIFGMLVTRSTGKFTPKTV